MIEDERKIRAACLAKHRAEEREQLGRVERESLPPDIPTGQDNEPARRPVLSIRA